MGSKLFLPTGRAKKATIKITTISNLFGSLTVSTAQFYFLKIYFKPVLRTKKTPGILQVLPTQQTAKCLGKGKDSEISPALAAAKDPMPAAALDISSHYHMNRSFCTATAPKAF